MTWRRYRKRPVTIEAVQFTGDNAATVLRFAPNELVYFTQGNDIAVHTLEGEMRAMPGDWIIRGVKNEVYPCKPDIFEATYEAVE